MKGVLGFSLDEMMASFELKEMRCRESSSKANYYIITGYIHNGNFYVILRPRAAAEQGLQLAGELGREDGAHCIRAGLTSA